MVGCVRVRRSAEHGDRPVQQFRGTAALCGISAAPQRQALQAQRLVRRVCVHCCEAYRPTAAEIQDVGIDPDRFFLGQESLVVPLREEDGTVIPLAAPSGRKLPPPGHLYRAAGCDKCHGSGYAGRTGLYEVLMITEDIRRLAIRNADSGQIKAAALAQGMRTLRDDGAHKVLCGITTLEEVIAVTAEES